VKDPPEQKTGNESAANCSGVTERGECRDGRAVSCDLTKNQLNTVDCVAIGRTCVNDVHRGVTCEMVPTSGGADGPDEESPCGSGVTLAGFCAGTSAIWCATSTGETIAWDCAADGLACKVDDCAFGAYCCGTASMPPTPSMTSECDRLGLAGECASGIARWCAGGTIREDNCATMGKTCQVDACAFGAYCCGTTVNECDTLGLRGECGGTGGNTARWCLGDALTETDCATDNGICLIDVCGIGANCCSCDTLGEAGRCDGNTVHWCADGSLFQQDCGTSTCEVDTCGSGAYCCP
jgi:hypothetical protein